MPHLGWFDTTREERRSAPPIDVGNVIIGVTMVLVVLLLFSCAFWK